MPHQVAASFAHALYEFILILIILGFGVTKF